MVQNDQPNQSDVSGTGEHLPLEIEVTEALRGRPEEPLGEVVDIVSLPEAESSDFEPPDNPVPTPSQLPEEVFRDLSEGKGGHFEAIDSSTVIWRADKQHWWQKSLHEGKVEPDAQTPSDLPQPGMEILPESQPRRKKRGLLGRLFRLKGHESSESGAMPLQDSNIQSGELVDPSSVKAISSPEGYNEVIPEVSTAVDIPAEQMVAEDAVIEDITESSSMEALPPAQEAPVTPETEPEASPETIVSPDTDYQDYSGVDVVAVPIKIGQPKEGNLLTRLFPFMKKDQTNDSADTLSDSPLEGTAPEWIDSGHQPSAKGDINVSNEQLVTEAVVINDDIESDISKSDQRRRNKRLKKEAAQRRREARKRSRQEKVNNLKGKLKRDSLADRRNRRIGSDAQRESLIQEGATATQDYTVEGVDETSPEAIAAITEGIADIETPDGQTEAPEALINDQDREESQQERKREVVITPKEDLEDLEEEGAGRKGLFTKLLRQYGDMIGVDIGSRNVRVAHVKDGELLLLASRQLPVGIFDDGLLVEPELFSRELAILWKQAGIKSKRINFSVLNRQVAMRLLELQAEEREDLQMAIVMNADSVLDPISTETATIDYSELSRSATGVSIQLAAAEKAMVLRLVKATEQAPAKLLASGCEISTLAAARSLIIPRSARSAHMLLDIGAQTTGLIFASGRDIFFLRVLDIGGDDFTQEVANACGCSFERAEYIKQRVGLDPAVEVPEISPEERKPAQAALIRMADRLCNEISRTREYYLNQPGGREVKGMTLIGGGSRLVGLEDQLKLFSGIEEAFPPKAVPAFAGIQEIDLYATAIGLAESQKMSLLPDSERLNFSMAAPGQRRHSKISTKKHKERVKASGIGQRKQSRVSSKTMTIFAAIAALGVCYYVGSVYFKAENSNLRTEKKAAVQQRKLEDSSVKPPMYRPTAGLEDVAAYNSAVAQTMPNPNPRLTGAVLSSLASLKAVDLDIQSGGNSSLTIKGNVPEGTQLPAVQKKLESIQGVVVSEDIQPGSGDSAGNSFEITLQLPMWSYQK